MKKLVAVCVTASFVSIGILATQGAFAWHGKLNIVNSSKYTENIHIDPNHGNLWLETHDTCSTGIADEYKGLSLISVYPYCTLRFDMTTTAGQTEDYVHFLPNDNDNCSYTINNDSQGLL